MLDFGLLNFRTTIFRLIRLFCSVSYFAFWFRHTLRLEYTTHTIVDSTITRNHSMFQVSHRPLEFFYNCDVGASSTVFSANDNFYYYPST
jgi:hypothetical protein